MRVLLLMLLFACATIAFSRCAGSRNLRRQSCNFIRHRILKLNALFNYRCHNDEGYISSWKCQIFASKIYMKLLIAQRLGCVHFESDDMDDSSEESMETGDSSEESVETGDSSEESEETGDSSEESEETGESSEENSEGESEESSEETDGGGGNDGQGDPESIAACETVVMGQCDFDGNLESSGCGTTGGFCDTDNTIPCVICT